MSIIYDALEKTQQERDKQVDKPVNLTPKRKKSFRFKLSSREKKSIILTGVTLSLLGLLTFKAMPIIQYFTHPLPPLVIKPILTADVVEAAFKKKHIFRGVFISEDEKLALIDNSMYHVGDSVDDLKITVITAEGIRLKNNHTSILLHTPG